MMKREHWLLYRLLTVVLDFDTANVGEIVDDVCWEGAVVVGSREEVEGAFVGTDVEAPAGVYVVAEDGVAEGELGRALDDG